MSTTPNRRMVAVVLLIPVVVTIALWAFAWPAARIAPRDLPLGIAGSAPAADRLQQQLEQHGGAFEIHRFDDGVAARTAIEDRVVYGAVVITPKGPQLLTASAASPMVAQLLREAVTHVLVDRRLPRHRAHAHLAVHQHPGRRAARRR
ncbi:hypothetical protein ACWCO9_40010, partial [Streptomyces sp. NPDC001937]